MNSDLGELDQNFKQNHNSAYKDLKLARHHTVDSQITLNISRSEEAKSEDINLKSSERKVPDTLHRLKKKSTLDKIFEESIAGNMHTNTQSVHVLPSCSVKIDKQFGSEREVKIPTAEPTERKHNKSSLILA